MKNPDIFQRQNNRLAGHQQSIHRDSRGRFSTRDNGKREMLNFSARGAGQVDQPEAINNPDQQPEEAITEPTENTADRQAQELGESG